MIIVASLEAVAIIAVAFLLVRARSEADRETASERQMLLERIQRPERHPTLPVDEFVTPEPEPDEFDLVGTIQEPGEEE